MATRSDITVIQELSPRYAEIAAPSTEIVMQDYVDTMRVEEERFQSLGFPFLLSASGKQSLGGGTKVAITVQEENLQLAFQPRTTPAVIGTVTTGSGAVSAVGRYQFVDSGADFIAAGVKPGSFIVNFTDKSVCDVVRVIDATTLETRQLANGTDNEFDIGDSYHLWNIIQCTTSGGNLVATDDIGGEISPILPTAFTQVILQTSSSATIQELVDIQFASYDGGVTIETGQHGLPGVDFPIGTRRAPVNNWTDALYIAQTKGLKRFYVEDSQTIPEGLDLSDNFYIVGDGATVVTLTIPASCNTNNLRIQDVTLFNSHMDALNLVERCVVYNCTMGGGFYYASAFAGSNTMVGNTQTNIFQCYSAVAGGGPSQTPEFLVGDAIIAGRDWMGGVEFKSKTGTGGFSWDMSSGQVLVDDSCVAGEMTFRGIGKWTNRDTYAGTTTINANELFNESQIEDTVWGALVADHLVAGSFGQLVGRKLLSVAKFIGLK